MQKEKKERTISNSCLYSSRIVILQQQFSIENLCKTDLVSKKKVRVSLWRNLEKPLKYSKLAR